MEHGATVQRLAEHSRSVRRTALIRAAVGLSLLTSWGFMTATGLIMAVGPWEDIEDLELRSRTIFLGMDQASWGGVHMGVAYVAVTVTVVHLLVVWRALRGYLHHATSRPAVPKARGAPARPARSADATPRRPARAPPADRPDASPPQPPQAPPVTPEPEAPEPVAGPAPEPATGPDPGDRPTVIPVRRATTGSARRGGSPPAASLTVTTPDGARRQIDVMAPWMTVGLGPDHLLTIADPMVSYNHAGIRWEAPQYVLYDLNSRNGTRVNGQLVRRALLRSGDEIQVGASHIAFQTRDPTADRQDSPSGST